MSITHPLITVGILVYNGEKYFDFLFESLFSQDYPNLEILILDNASPENDNEILREKWGEKLQIFRSEENLGFAGGHNFLIRKMSGEYYFCLNQDIFIEHNFVSELVKIISSDDRIGSATGKLRRWDFSKGGEGKTNLLDTVGIKVSAFHRFTDTGQGEEDLGQYDQAEEIFAASGAAVIYRKKALEDIAVTKNNGEKEYFDEDFFMYKEDIDLGYRLRWAGWNCLYTPSAVGYHDRTVAQKRIGILEVLKGRMGKSVPVRKLSWRNHQLVLFKNFSKEFSQRIRWKTWCYQISIHIFMSIFEPKLYYLAEAEKHILKKQMRQKKVTMKKRVSAQQLEKFFV